ncbi:MULTISPECIES: DNA polymerase III subunit alpha [Actinomycetes]|uniref:DNA polymerase III subunit alpha n=4 Tax=Actinomycetes TaxID=1760 RepID=A0A2H1K890_BRELN|nr:MULTISPECIES: DNA polymerase III subunit alpha [Actinomycetes]MDN5585313.1 DNA polymerase III subunit alpha [Brevibacterium sp.]AHI20863.1 DNA polymerase III subunit alpha [Corynebacterium casei LMG S-19264]SMX69937.1 DNA polymerase III, alpha subunit [Brevibacterium antiquum]SMX95452.1 DNA polymerase III, alpha subunit [Brevibacterium linens ATCC 9172]SMY04990.1 DNA polymerase III, alpha subunit [Brevibacterium antiquum CNRZ 918]
MPSFTHLHVASAFTAHHGTAHPETLVAAAVVAGADAAAITDHDGIFGAIRHVRACLAAGIDPIVGANLQTRDDNGQLSTVTVLAHGHNHGAGWAGLVRLISAAHSPRRRQHTLHGTAHRSAWITPDQAPAFLSGETGPVATVLLGPGSDVGRAVLNGDRPRARALLEAWERRLPGGIAVEIVCHHTRPGTAASLQQAADMLQLARVQGVPVVLTNVVRFLRPDDAITGDVLDSAAFLLPLGAFEPHSAQAWLKPASVMHDLAYRICDYAGLRRDDAIDLLAHTERVADWCRLGPETDLRWRHPKVPELEAIGLAGADPVRVLRQRCEAAITDRYPHAYGTGLRRVRDRLSDELATIGGFGFESYFLTVADVVDLIRDMGVRVQARGSGAGSLVNHLLRISAVDPIEHSLLSERFLGNARSTLPDIDIDVESARRHDIYRAVFDRYGHHRVTLLSMQSTYRARGAVRDAGAALGLDLAQIDRIAKNIWRFNPADFRQALETKPELRDVAAQVKTDAQLDLLVDLTARLDRLPRHISMHPCGVILGDSDLLSLTATQPSGMGLPMSQFDKDDIDDAGLLKLDILGVRMQSSIAHTLTEIARVNGATAAVEGRLPVDAPYVAADGRVDLEQIPHDDEPTFELIRSTHTLGCFQIESPGQRELLGKMQPDQYEDLVADISLFRPGPIQANMVAPFINAKLGYAPIIYLHPRFRPFLAETYGVLIYHEQLMRVLADCMDISLAEADEIRRALATDSAAIEARFRARTAGRVDERGRRLFRDREIDRIWTNVAAFGSFGFCKAHGASFALPTYQSAWLKQHYPVEFLTGILEHDPGMYPRRLLVAEARRLGITLLPIDINASSDQYRVEQVSPGIKAIRFSFRDISGITDVELTRILDGQPYTSITDLYERARPSRPLMMRLARIGAFDSLTRDEHGQAHRGGIIAYVRQLTARTHKKAVMPQPNQVPLFGDEVLVDAAVPDPSAEERIATDLEVLSTEVDGHVMDLYRPMLEGLGLTHASELLGLRSGTEVLVAGVRVATQTPPMRSGRRTVFISLDDGTGCIDVTFFQEAQQEAASGLFTARMMTIRGRTRRTGERGISIQAEEAFDLMKLWRDWNQSRSRPEMQE